MPAQGKRLNQIAPSATTETTLYTVPASTYTRDLTAIIHNYSGANCDVTINLRPLGAAKANANQVFKQTLTTNQTITWENIGILNPTDVLSVTASVANAVTVTLSGVEVS